MALNDTVQPSEQHQGVFDSILGAIVKGVEVYRNDHDDSYNDASRASNFGASNTQLLVMVGLVGIGLYLVFKD